MIVKSVCILSLGIAMSTPTSAQTLKTREESLLNAFQIMCNLAPPVFDHIDAQATAMRMQLIKQEAGPAADNTTSRRKAWVGKLTDGTFAVFDDELSGRKGVTTACAVTGPIPSADAFRREAIRELGLGDAPRPEFTPDGARSFSWRNVNGATYIVRDFPNEAKVSVMVKIVVTVRPAT